MVVVEPVGHARSPHSCIRSICLASPHGVRACQLEAPQQGMTKLQLMLATGWQPHSVRGAISGPLRKRLGLNVGLTRNAAGGRVYRIG